MLELEEIYGAIYISILISLTVLSGTIYENDKDRLNIFLVSMNALIFVVEIVIIAIKLERGNLEYFHIFLISICIVIGVLLAILLPIFFEILPVTITVFFV